MYIFHFNIEITTKEPNGGMKHKEITVKKVVKKLGEIRNLGRKLKWWSAKRIRMCQVVRES